MEKAGDRFHILPGVSIPASDETLFGNINWIKQNEKQVDIIVTEFLHLWQEMAADPSIIEKERAKRGLMSDQPKEVLADITNFYTAATKAGIYEASGGGVDAAKIDFAFYTEANQMTGPAEGLKVEDYWYLAPLDRAHKALGK
jgi:NitT/TauT family transport system substrate-binding protein